MAEVVMQTLSKQQLRTRETQDRLLDAAEEVFVRDGYEGAQLDEIAGLAGRSKGAVYTHFKSKEDLFLVLFEHRTRSYIDRLMTDLLACPNRQQRRQVFREFFVGLANDRNWPILTLEFKLFAIRHPESKERLRKAFAMSKPAYDGEAYTQMFGQMTQTDRADNDLVLAALGPIVTGLILESHFEPQMLNEPGIKHILGRIFDALLP